MTENTLHISLYGSQRGGYCIENMKKYEIT